MWKIALNSRIYGRRKIRKNCEILIFGISCLLALSPTHSSAGFTDFLSRCYRLLSSSPREQEYAKEFEALHTSKQVHAAIEAIAKKRRDGLSEHSWEVDHQRSEYLRGKMELLVTKELRDWHLGPALEYFSSGGWNGEVINLQKMCYFGDPSFEALVKALNDPTLTNEQRIEVVTVLTGVRKHLYDGPVSIEVTIKDLIDTFNNGGVSLVEAARNMRRTYADKIAAIIREFVDFDLLQRSLRTLTESKALTLDDATDPGGLIFKAATRTELVISRNLDLTALTTNERDLLNTYAAAAKKTHEELFVGHNAKLLEIHYTEAVDPPMSGAIHKFVSESRYLAGGWWSNPKDGAEITAATSRSPVRRLYGNDAVREIYWPLDKRGGQPQLDRIRIALNSVRMADGKLDPKSIEMFAKDASGNWQPFFFTLRNGKWVPAEKFLGKSIKTACATCHMYPDGRFSPRPKILQNEEDLLAVGYKKSIIRKLMRMSF